MAIASWPCSSEVFRRSLAKLGEDRHPIEWYQHSLMGNPGGSKNLDTLNMVF